MTILTDDQEMELVGVLAEFSGMLLVALAANKQGSLLTRNQASAMMDRHDLDIACAEKALDMKSGTLSDMLPHLKDFVTAAVQPGNPERN